MPHACIGVDIIVGFPGETEEHFMETYNFLNGLDVSYFHVFTYSERENTKAIEMPGIVPTALREERNSRLRILSEKKRRAFYASFAGSSAQVLFEEEKKGHDMYGFTDNYLKVSVPYEKEWVNQLKTVQLTHLDDQGIFKGTLCVEQPI